MTNHKATTRQWSGIERFVRYGAYDSCIIELRDRVEALEAAAKPAESNCQETLDSSLVELVADAIYSNATGGVREEARAAILAVADWFDQQKLHIAATLLRQEAQ
jgi:hypothetical protein